MVVKWKEYGEGKSRDTAVVTLYHCHTPEMDCYVERSHDSAGWNWSLYIAGPHKMRAQVYGFAFEAEEAKRNAAKMVKMFSSTFPKGSRNEQSVSGG